MESLINNSLIFVFIFSILVVLKDIGNIILVMSTERGKLNMNRLDTTILGCALSYIITMLIYWV